MKNLTVRLSDLDHKRLSEQAIKRGGTISDAMREIVNQFFEKQNEKAEHEKTRARFSDIDKAFLDQVQEIQNIKKSMKEFINLFGKFIENQARDRK